MPDPHRECETLSDKSGQKRTLPGSGGSAALVLVADLPAGSVADDAAGGAIPKKHTGEGEDVSPPLAWKGVPEGTKQLALICDDPDAPMAEPFVHWVLYGLSPELEGLEEGKDGGGTSGQNSWGKNEYGGPMPPPGHGLHHYHFKLYALDTALDLAEGATKKQLLEAMEGHVLATGELIGTYERQE